MAAQIRPMQRRSASGVGYGLRMLCICIAMSAAISRAAPPLDEAHQAYHQGRIQLAEQRLGEVDPNDLNTVQSLLYQRLQFELAFESNRYPEAIAAGNACRKLYDKLKHADYSELAIFAIRFAQACQANDHTTAAERHLQWAIARWPSAANLATTQRQMIDPQGRFELARIRAVAAYARLQTATIPSQKHANDAPSDPTDKLWRTIATDCRRWFAERSSDTIDAESCSQCVEELVTGLIACEERQQAIDAVGALASKSYHFKGPMDSVRWQATLARQFERLDDARSMRILQGALVALKPVRPQNEMLTRQKTELLANLTFDAARLESRFGDADRARNFAKHAQTRYLALEAESIAPRERLIYLARLQQLAEQLDDLRGAIEIGKRWIDLQASEFDPLDPRLVVGRAAVASQCLTIGDVDEAASVLQAGDLDLLRHREPFDAHQWGSALLVLCQVEKAQGKYLAPRARLQAERDTWKAHSAQGDLLWAKLEAQLAEFFVAEGDYRRATGILSDLQGVLSEDGADSEQTGERSALLAQVLLTLTLVHDAQGHFDDALRLCEKAYQERIKTMPHDAPETLPYHLASCRANLHCVAEGAPDTPTSERDNLLEAARHHTNLCLDIIERTGQHDTIQCARVLYHRGLLLDYERNSEAALKDWQHALGIARLLKVDEILQSRLLVHLGQTLADELHLETADEQLAEATLLLEKLEILPGLHYTALCTRAQVQLAMARRIYAKTDERRAQVSQQAAFECLMKAVDLMELPRASSTSGEIARAQFFARYALAYDLLVDLLASRYDNSGSEDDLEQALYYADRSRNRTLLDQLASSANPLLQAVGPEAERLQQQRATLLQECVDIEAQLLALQNRLADSVTPHDSDEIDIRQKALQGKLHDNRNSYADCHARLQDSIGLQPGAAVAYPSCNLHEWYDTLEAIRSQNDVLVFHTSSHGSHAFLITRNESFHWPLRLPLDGAESTSTPLTVSQLANMVDRYRQIVMNPTSSEMLLDPSAPATPAEPRSGRELQEYSHAVAQAILPPGCRNVLMRLQREGRGVVVVADGPLQRLPFEALMWAPGNQPLFAIDRLPPLVYTPSLMTLHRISARRDTRNATESPSLVTIGIEDFTFWGRRPLREAPAESSAIAEAFAAAYPRGRVQILKNADANKASLKLELSRVPCTHLHLAAHADVDHETQGLFGRILLSPPTDRSDRSAADLDAALNAYEVPSLPLNNCELVLLSGCNTNVGPTVPLECASSLLRSFLAAGASRVVGSHWSADDESTAKLMTHFIMDITARGKVGSPQYSQALHAAQQEVRRTDPAPYYWAPFVLYGPGR